MTQEELNQLDALLERAYFSDLPREVRSQAWFLHGELRQRDMVQRRWIPAQASVGQRTDDAATGEYCAGAGDGA